jgi:type IV pilus assembly protein PilC
MLVYRYAAINQKEKRVHGSIDAKTEQDALDMLNQKQYQVLEIYCKGERNPLIGTLKTIWDEMFKKVKDQDLLLFTRELGLMLKVGIPIDRVFNTLAGLQDDMKLNQVLVVMREDLRRGYSLSGAMRKHPRVFAPIYRTLVEVGEDTGQLDQILDELASYQEKELMTKKRVQSALMYPAFVMGCTAVILTVMMIYYVPSFIKFLEGMNTKLPIPTQVLMIIVHSLQNPGTLTAIVLSLVIGGYVYYNFSRTMLGRFFVDNVKLNLPVFGELLLMLGMARFARTFALMYKSGIQIDKILDSSKDIVDNEPLKDIMEAAKNDIINGESISHAFTGKKYIPTLMKSFLILGDETENVAFSMEKIAEIYDEQIEYRIESLISMMEPVFMATVACIVGFVVLSLFLPIYSLISNMGT